MQNIKTNVLVLVAKAEIGEISLNYQLGEMLRITITEMGHAQPSSPVITDNDMANGIFNRTVKQRRTKAIEMRFN